MTLVSTTSLSPAPTKRPSTTASSAPGRTRSDSARPPINSSMASTTSVLPAPVSPVSAVMPASRTRVRSAITPRSRTRSSVSMAAPSSFRQTELSHHDVMELPRGERDEDGVMATGDDLDGGARLQGGDGLAVDDQLSWQAIEHLHAHL